MSANLISSLGDDGADLHKQIGCMTGIFQIFDRQHMLSGRRPSAHNQKRPHSGNTAAETNGCSPRAALDKSRSSNDNQRLSMESSRNSFSSSSCSSSFSSLECNRTMQKEHSTYEAAMAYADVPSKEVAKSRVQVVPSPGSFAAPVKTSEQSTDFRGIVKDSLHREAQGLRVKTSAAEAHRGKNLAKLKDSPRLQQLSKSEESRKTPMAIDVDGSPTIALKLEEKPRDTGELKEHPRPPSAIIRENILSSLSRDTPRFSYDGRDNPRVSLDSRDGGSSAYRLRDLPRLSLDSREIPTQNSDFRLNADYGSKYSDRSRSQQKVSRVIVKDVVPREEQQSPSVVAKLMGLEALPNICSASPDRMGLKRFGGGENSGAVEAQTLSSCSNSSRAASPKSSIKVTIVPQKSISNSKIPMESAPWKQPGKGRISSKMAGLSETCAVQKHESVYGEIQKKLKDLEFQSSNKDLRALKQILDAIHAKGLLTAKDGGSEEHSELSGKKNRSWKTSLEIDDILNPEDANYHQDDRLTPNLITDTSNQKSWDSPIVIMKPAKSYNAGVHDCTNDVIVLPKVRTSDTAADSQHVSADLQPEKDRTPKNLLRENSGHVQVNERRSIDRIGENALQKDQPRGSKTLSKHQKLSNESGGVFVKNSNPSSPRLQNKKLTMEKKVSSSPISDISKQQKALRRSSESVSLVSKSKSKSRPEKKVADSFCQPRKVNSRGIEVSRRLGGNRYHEAQADIDPASSDHGSPSSIRKVSDGVTSNIRRKKDQYTDSCSPADGATSTSEQPSPISVLDASNELSGSPANKSLFPFADPGNQSTGTTNSARWNSEDLEGCRTRDIDRQKLRNIEDLVQKLEQLSSTDNQESEANHIASLCETQNPNHHYVSEILLASGLLLNNLDGSFPSIQPHQSGYPINPDFFLVLEQKKTGCLVKPEVDLERIRRRLTFDTVNEVLIRKFELDGGGPLPASWVRAGKLSKRVPSGQLLLKELCREIEQLEGDGRRDGHLWEEEADELTMILAKDIDGDLWTDPRKEVSWLVLDIERLIFKDLIGEVVTGVIPVARAKSHPRRRQLFV